MDTPEVLKYATYFAANLAYTYVLVWGFRSVTEVLKEPVDRGVTTQGGGMTTPKTNSAGYAMLSTPQRVKPSRNANAAPDTTPPPLDLSYAKVSGAIGSISIASLFVGLSYYILFGLFFGNDTDIDIGEQLEGLQIYFLAGAALFLPYAFESLIFKP